MRGDRRRDGPIDDVIERYERDTGTWVEPSIEDQYEPELSAVSVDDV